MKFPESLISKNKISKDIYRSRQRPLSTHGREKRQFRDKCCECKEVQNSKACKLPKNVLNPGYIWGEGLGFCNSEIVMLLQRRRALLEPYYITTPQLSPAFALHSVELNYVHDITAAWPSTL